MKPTIHTILSTLLFGGLIFWMSCQQNTTDSVENEGFDAAAYFQNQCSSCHALEKDGVGPSLKDIRSTYLQKFESEKAFVEGMYHFLNQPTRENALFANYVEKTGPMPKLLYNDIELKLFLEYLFSTEINQTNWTANTSKTEAETVTDFVAKGSELASKTKAELGKNLMAAIAANGPHGAVDFCNTKAIPITDSMSKALNAKIKRVSNKPRNPLNQANENEAAFIQELAENQDKGLPLTPKIKETKSHFLGYYPIIISDNCLQCHGTFPKEISEKTAVSISQKYPQDKATGYKADEIRGIFVVEFSKN
jgi:cytochrome c551/c552